jgi:hypothetical protein
MAVSRARERAADRDADPAWTCGVIARPYALDPQPTADGAGREVTYDFVLDPLG